MSAVSITTVPTEAQRFSKKMCIGVEQPGTVCQTLPRLKKTFNECHCERKRYRKSSLCVILQQSTLCFTRASEHAKDVDSGN